MDAYDHMVAWLTDNPEQIQTAWIRTATHRCGALFKYAVPNQDKATRRPDGVDCGCLTMIRNPSSSFGNAWTDALTIAIRADERLPRRSDDITTDHLPIFAGWQRRIDSVLNRTPPVWNSPPVAKPEVEMRAAPSVGVEVVSE